MTLIHTCPKRFGQCARCGRGAQDDCWAMGAPVNYKRHCRGYIYGTCVFCAACEATHNRIGAGCFSCKLVFNVWLWLDRMHHCTCHLVQCCIHCILAHLHAFEDLPEQKQVIMTGTEHIIGISPSGNHNIRCGSRVPFVTFDQTVLLVLRPSLSACKLL